MEKIKRKFTKLNSGTNGPLKLEFVVGILIVVFSTIMFCFMKDFKLTVTQSIDFLDCLFHGKVFRYYSEVNSLALSGYYGIDWPSTLLAGANYSIINYASIGLICLPVYALAHIFNFSVPFLVYEFCIKIGYALIVVYMTKIVYDIAQVITGKNEKAKWVALCFLTSPIMLFSSVMISHLDIFSVLFMLLGLRSIMEKKQKSTLVFFMLAAAYKPFVLLCIIPILFYKEKRIIYLVRNLFVVLLGILAQNVVYHFDPGYAECQKFMSETYDFIGRFFGTGFIFNRNCYESISSLFIVSFIVICIFAYILKNDKDIYVFFLPFLVMVMFILFVKWHPNWMVLMVPFLAILFCYVKNVRVSCILETVFALFFIIVSGLGWPANYDIEIINGGIVPQLLKLTANGNYDIRTYLTRKLPTIPLDIYGSVLWAVTLGMALVFCYELVSRVRSKQMKDFSSVAEWERCAVWVRVLPALAYMAYAIFTCIKK